MKKLIPLMLLTLTACVAAQTPGAAPGVVGKTQLSPAEQRISQARKEIETKPTQFSGYNQLADAFLRRARETSDFTYYAQAEEALSKSLALAPKNFEGEKVRVRLMLDRHEYSAALEAAKALNKKVPDDIFVYGYLTEANAELGNYDDAEKAAQWMLNLRPGNLPSLINAAYLRELFGDPDGADELLNMAYQSTFAAETEDRARILSQMGHLRFVAGRTDDAERLLTQALETFPGYHSALGNLAQVRIAQKRYDEAVTLLQQRYQAAPHASNLYDLAEALQFAGRDGEARKAFAEFERQVLAESTDSEATKPASADKDAARRQLVFYYADHAPQPAKALDLAKRQFAWRHDVYTLDAYAWALHVNGQDAEARKQIETALAVGIRDSKIFAHAGEIVLKLGDRAAAQKYLEESVSLHATGSDHAQLILVQVSGPAGQR